MEEHIDSKILKCIEKEYKSYKRIAEEINCNSHRVKIRLRSLRTSKMITFIPGKEKTPQIKNGGFPPTLYKKRTY